MPIYASGIAQPRGIARNTRVSQITIQTNQNDTRIVDSRSICSRQKAHQNFSALPLLCRSIHRRKFECNDVWQNESISLYQSNRVIHGVNWRSERDSHRTLAEKGLPMKQLASAVFSYTLLSYRAFT